MRQIVIMPGGFHPFHAGHAALYKSAVETFNNADVYVAATNDTKTRPFPFSIKEKLAKLAGVADKHFVQVKSPFQAKEITQHYNPDEDVLIFVRSEKDKNEQPKPGGTKKDGSPAYFQPWTGKNLQPFSKHAYIAYLPTVEFGPGITSASEIRDAWPTLNDKRKTAMVMSLYPTTQKNPKLAANVVKMLDMGMGNEVAEAIYKVDPISKSVPIQKTVIHPVKQHMHSPPEKKTTPAVVNHIKPRDTLKEFVPPSGDDGSGDNRSRRIRKLLEIAIQVAKEKNIDELGMIHGMNMIAGDDFFNTAVEGILPDITDKEYMFVLQSAYKTVKQGLAEAKKKRKKKSKNRSLGRYFFPGYSYYGGSGESGEGGGDGGGGEGKIKEGDTARIFHPQYVDVYYLDGPRRTPILVNRKVPYNLVDRYLELAIKKYNLQQGRFEFRNAEEEKVAEGLGIPYPTTYEQENNKFKRRGPMRITAMTEFAPPGSDDREPDEEEILRQLAAQWWNGSIQQMKKAQQTLQAMGWEIGQDESGDDDAGVFVIRIGDENGDSYIAFPHSELGLNEDYLNEK
jgi:glycerol-3-phosphate cytidylyltransferase-like family protein